MHEVKWIWVELIRVGWLSTDLLPACSKLELDWQGIGLICIPLLGYKHALIDVRVLLNTH